jgi:hypothetical protein
MAAYVVERRVEKAVAAFAERDSAVSDPARAARAAVGSASASFRISAASRFVVRF